MESKKKDNNLKDVPSKLILYIGQDLSFLKELEEKYKELSSGTGAIFQQIFEPTPEGAQSLVIQIKELRPKIVLIDYSNNALALLHLTRVWLRQNCSQDTNLIGLCDYAQGSSIILKSVMTTIKCVHIKSSELEAICFDINLFAFPDQSKPHGFATAKLAEAITVCYPAKAAYVQQDEIRIESDIDLLNSKNSRLHSYWSKSDIIGAPDVELKSQLSEGLFYNHRYAQILKILHADPVVADDDTADDEMNILKQRRDENISSSREKLSFWINKHIEYSKPKFLKALIVDKENSLFRDRPISDQYDYIFRTQSYLENPKEEILKLKPHIIIYHIGVDEKAGEVEAQDQDIAHTFNTLGTLKNITTEIAKLQGKYEPYIIAFNTIDQTTETLQRKFNYKNIIAITDTIDVELVLKMCKMLKAKIEPTLQAMAKDTIYIDKNSDVSYGEIEGEITLKAISESDVYFDSEVEIPEKTVFRMYITHSFYVTVMPMPSFASIEAQYYGIIHGIGEEERKVLRQFVNDIFFKELQDKKALEAEEVRKQKEKFLNDKKSAEEKELDAKKIAEKKENELAEKAKKLIEETEKAPQEEK